MSTEHTMARVEAGDLTLIYAADDPTASACLVSDGAALQINQPDDVIELAIAFMRQTAKRKAPEPGPIIVSAPPRFPKPADFQDEIVLGDLLGSPVIGLACWDEVDGSTRPLEVVVEMNGLTLNSDGENLGVNSYATGDGMPLRDLSALTELWQSGLIAKFVKIARRWCADG